jgi:hypothetical protein
MATPTAELERELAMLESERGQQLVIESPSVYGSVRVRDKTKTLTGQNMIAMGTRNQTLSPAFKNRTG